MSTLEDAAEVAVEPLVAVAMVAAPADLTSYESDALHESVRAGMAVLVAAARFAVESKHQKHGGWCTCGFESARARSHTEHVMSEFFDELAEAARAARKGKAVADEHTPTDDHRCPRCGSRRWVGYGIGAGSGPVKAQCVPCGSVYDHPKEKSDA